MTASYLSFKRHTREDAPEKSKSALARLEQNVGAIPNLAATMAGAPALIDGFVTLREIIQKTSGFTAQERELLFLTNAVTNDCNYCQTIHAMFASKTGLDAGTIEAVKNGKPLSDPRQNALVSFDRLVVKNKGQVAAKDVEAFIAAGFDKANILEVVACLAQSIMANYTNHIANVELDDFLKPKNTANAA